MIQTHTIAALMEMEIPEPSFVVKDMFVEGNAVLFSAREKAGKGFIMLHAAVSIANGRPFLGRDVKQGPVVYLALEESKRTIRDRLRVLAAGHHDLPVHIASLDGSEGQVFRLEDHDSIVGLRDLMTNLRPVLVIIDVLREAHDGRENDSDDMAWRLANVRSLAHDTGICIVVTHHMSREGHSRGSTAIGASFDETFEFTRTDLETDTCMRGLITGKGRDVPKIAQHIEFDPDTYAWQGVEGAPVHSQPTNIREKIVQVLNTTDEWLTAEGIADLIPDTKLQTVRNKLSDMVAERPCRLLIEGGGGKGDPRRYHGIHKRKDTNTHHSGNNPGTTQEGPTLLVRRCVQCRKPLSVPGALYCPEHGGTEPLQPTGTEGEVKI